MDPGTGGAAVHQRDHDGREEEYPRQAGQIWIDQVNQQTADGSAHGAGDHAVGAFLITGLEEQKGMKREPICVLKFPKVADRAADGHDHSQTQGKTQLKPAQREPLAQIFPNAGPGNLLKQRSQMGCELLPA